MRLFNVFFLSFYNIDNTPPTVKNCPKDIIKTTDRLAEVISWPEPLFTDNVAIRHIMFPVRKSGESWYPGEDLLMQYIATDIAGNQVKCSFKVALKCKSSYKLALKCPVSFTVALKCIEKSLKRKVLD